MSKRKSEDLSNLSVVGVDIGKDVFHLVGFDAEGNLVLRQRIMHRNKLAIALANKLARIAWSVVRHGTPFDAQRDEVMASV